MRAGRLVLPVVMTLASFACKDAVGPRYIEIIEVTVGPALARCYGVGEQTCLVVDGKLFYDGIDGFTFEAGYSYRLRIGKYDPWNGGEPPQDAGRYAYRLLEQMEKTRAPSTPATLLIGPTRVTCSNSDDFCLLVNGVPYNDIITNFEYEAGFYYHLNVNKYGDGRHVLDEIVTKDEATGTDEEIVVVGPGRVQCDDNRSIYCRVVNGAPFRSEIVGFQPVHGYSYRIRVVRFSMFPGGVTPPSDDIPIYGYRWLETLERNPGN